MKTAQTTNGKLITASADSPKEAICPFCGGTVTLRGRRLMIGNQVSYFWRHRSNQNRRCSGRKRPV